jgi:peptidoglycan/xylan/chitin deacetylase (PgdA/CDA1 family)
LSAEQAKDEIVSAKNIIESHIGRSINVFAYPFGGHNGESEKILQETGFVAAVTAQRGLACAKLPYELPRIRVGNGSLSTYGL